MPDPRDLIADRILLISYGGGHAAVLAPIATELRNRGLPFAILALTTAPLVYRRHALDTFGLGDIVDHVEGYEEAREAGVRLADRQDPNGLVPRDETEAYLGIGFTDLVRMLGPDTAEHRYTEVGRQSFLPIPFFAQLFRQARPRAIVATNSP